MKYLFFFSNASQIWEGITTFIIPNLLSASDKFESLRAYLILPIYHEFMDANNYEKLHSPFAWALISLNKMHKDTLKNWLMLCQRQYFERIVKIFKDVVENVLKSKFSNCGNSMELDLFVVKYETNLELALEVLKLLFEINNNKRSQRSIDEIFQMPNLGLIVDIQKDFYLWSIHHYEVNFENYLNQFELLGIARNYLIAFFCSSQMISTSVTIPLYSIG